MLFTNELFLYHYYQDFPKVIYGLIEYNSHLNTCSFCLLSPLAEVTIKEETIDKIKGGTTKQVQNSGDQQGILQHTSEVVQLPQLTEASRKPEAVVGPEESKTSPGHRSKNSSSKNMNILPAIV